MQNIGEGLASLSLIKRASAGEGAWYDQVLS